MASVKLCHDVIRYELAAAGLRGALADGRARLTVQRNEWRVFAGEREERLGDVTLIVCGEFASFSIAVSSNLVIQGNYIMPTVARLFDYLVDE